MHIVVSAFTRPLVSWQPLGTCHYCVKSRAFNDAGLRSRLRSRRSKLLLSLSSISSISSSSSRSSSAIGKVVRVCINSSKSLKHHPSSWSSVFCRGMASDARIVQHGSAEQLDTDVAASSSEESELRYIDIGINLTDPIFRGMYHGKRGHEDDFERVIDRARKHHVRKMVVTGSDLKESMEAVEIAGRYPNLCYATIGVHPCSAKQFLQSKTLLDDLRALILSSVSPSPTESSSSASISNGTNLPTTSTPPPVQPLCIALGEIGLDYDRLFLTDKATQLKYFEAQLDLAVSLHTTPGLLPKPLPLFLHSRAAAEDFEDLLRPRLKHLPAKGVVHSFTGSVEEMERLLELGLDIGVNGCSLKTEENLEVVRLIPLERLHLETDGPWCEVRPSSAGMGVLGSGGSGGVAGGREGNKLGNAREGNKSGGGAGRVSGGPAGNGSAGAREAGKGSSKQESKETKEEILARFPKSVKKEKWTPDVMIKGRNEPCMVGLVAEIVARVKDVPVRVVVDAAWRNSCRVFGLDDS